MNRVNVLINHLTPAAAASPAETALKQSLTSCKEELRHHIQANNCHDHFMRLATLDVLCASEGKHSAADGSVMLAEGMDAGLDLAMEILKSVKKAHNEVSFADLIQMASAEALKLKGGPTIPMRYGRLDNEQAFAKVQGAASFSQEDMVQQASKMTASLRSAPLASFELLLDMGLTLPHSLALMADFEHDFKNNGPALPSTKLPAACSSLVSIYAKDDLALVRDYAWAQNKKSEIGATFYPEQGLRI